MMLRDLKPYKPLEGNFVVKFKRDIVKYAKGYTFQLRVGDSSGEIMVRYWGPDNREEVERLFSTIKSDDIVRIKGESTSYRDMVSINVNPPKGSIRVLKEGEFNPKDFLPVTERDQEKMFGELMEFVGSVENPDLKKILESFFKDEEFVKKFRKHPAAMYRHHGWIGGLLEHTLNVTKICDYLSEMHEELDRDLMITGALLHDIGKLKELEMTTSIKSSVEGIMIGHLLITLEMVDSKMDETGTPEKTRMKLKHILASHHGKLEYASPKTPAMPEALCVYYADDIDSKVVYMISRMKTASTEDDFVYTPDFGNIYLR